MDYPLVSAGGMLLSESGKLRKGRGGLRASECGDEPLIWPGRTDCWYEPTLPGTKTLNRRLIVLALRKVPFRAGLHQQPRVLSSG